MFEASATEADHSDTNISIGTSGLGEATGT